MSTFTDVKQREAQRAGLRRQGGQVEIVDAKVAEFLFRKATTEGPQCVTAAIFWMKTRGGWRETPQEHKVALTDVTRLSDQELERMIQFYQDEIARQEGKTLTLESAHRP